ncbi:MAG: hypothetical protein ACYDBB_07605 [Armatimonadota bacterium]
MVKIAAVWLGCCILTAVCLQGSFAAPAADTSVNKLIRLSFVRVEAVLDNQNASTPQGALVAMKAFWPKGIITVAPVPMLNALLVKADSEETIAQFELLMSLLDQPVKQVVVELTMLQVDVDDLASTGLGLQTAAGPASVVVNGAGEAPNSVRMVNGNTLATLNGMVTRGSAKTVSSPRLTVMNGGSGYIEFTEKLEGLLGLQVNKVSITNDQVGLQLVPLFVGDGPQVALPPVRVKNGETLFLGSYDAIRNEKATTGPVGTPPVNTNTLAKRTQVLLFVTPRIIQQINGAGNAGGIVFPGR